MQHFAYERATDEPSVLAALSDPDTTPIAGGTELLNWMRLGISAPRRVVDVGAVSALHGIAVDDEWITIGAATSLNDVGDHAAVLEHAAVLSQACLRSASAQIRNRATLGGNVLQRTRCVYFRAEEPVGWSCNKRDPGSGCGARDGIDADAAIFETTDDCVAAQPSDPAVALACLDAEIDLAGPNGQRWVPARSFHLTQVEAAAEGRSVAAETRLEPGEMIRGYRIPIVAGLRSSYVKVRERESYAFAIVSAAAAAQVSDGALHGVRIALGSVAQRPWRLPVAEVLLEGAHADADTVRRAVAQAMEDARPLAGNRHKVTLAANAAVRAIMEAAS